MSWGAIGARTTESQVHRELASGLSCPVGFKNGTDGTIKVAIDAIRGRQCAPPLPVGDQVWPLRHRRDPGNPDCHIILRGGREPNYSAAHVDEVVKGLDKAGLPQKVMIDFSHANSSKQFKNQMLVAEDVAGQLRAGSRAVFGVMVESHLVEGRQDLVEGCELTVGQSITDACIGWADTEILLQSGRCGGHPQRRLISAWRRRMARRSYDKKARPRVALFYWPERAAGMITSGRS